MIIIILLDVIVGVLAVIGLYTVLVYLKNKWFPVREDKVDIQMCPQPSKCLNHRHDVHAEYIFRSVFKLKHIHDVAKEMGVTLTHAEAMRVVNAVKDNFDLKVGISSGEIRVAIDYVLEFVREKR